jgi:hypothetical protein
MILRWENQALPLEKGIIMTSGNNFFVDFAFIFAPHASPDLLHLIAVHLFTFTPTLSRLIQGL